MQTDPNLNIFKTPPIEELHLMLRFRNVFYRNSHCYKVQNYVKHHDPNSNQQQTWRKVTNQTKQNQNNIDFWQKSLITTKFGKDVQNNQSIETHHTPNHNKISIFKTINTTFKIRHNHLKHNLQHSKYTKSTITTQF